MRRQRPESDRRHDHPEKQQDRTLVRRRGHRTGRRIGLAGQGTERGMQAAAVMGLPALVVSQGWSVIVTGTRAGQRAQ